MPRAARVVKAVDATRIVGRQLFRDRNLSHLEDDVAASASYFLADVFAKIRHTVKKGSR